MESMVEATEKLISKQIIEIKEERDAKEQQEKEVERRRRDHEIKIQEKKKYKMIW